MEAVDAGHSVMETVLLVVAARFGRGSRGGNFGDRHSGSGRTQVKSADAKEGHGKSDWGPAR